MIQTPNTLILLILTVFAFSFFALSISTFWLIFTDKTEGMFKAFGLWLESEKNEMLAMKEAKQKIPFLKLLRFKLLGGCDNCNAMWISILLVYPIYCYMLHHFNILSFSLNNAFIFALLFFLMPSLTVGMKNMFKTIINIDMDRFMDNLYDVDETVEASNTGDKIIGNE